MKLSEIVEFLGLDSKIKEDKEIEGINTLSVATPNEISFFHNPKYEKYISDTKAGAVIISKEFVDKVPEGVEVLITDEPYLMMAKLTAKFVKPLFKNKNVTIMDNVYIGEGSEIGKNSVIMSGAFIGDDVTIGDNCVIYPNVTIYNDTKIGDNTIIHAGAVIGSDGFGYAHTKTGEHVKIYHLGSVEIGNDVEIGANTTIDRGVLGKTIIKDGVKIDNLVQIGHNCDIGEYSIIVAQTGIAGSSILGRNVVMGGQSATAGHLKIAPFTTIASRGGVTKTVKEKGVYSGFPLMEHKLWLKLQAKISKSLK